jgi:hypothetical protein
MVNTILEQVEMDLSQYDENDFTDAFVFLFRNWIVNKMGDESKKYPFSFLLKKYGQKFLDESFGDRYSKYFSDRDVDFSRYMIPRIGKYFIQSGIHSLPSLRGEEKFTEKYARHIPRLIKLLEIPSWVKIEIKEDKPNEVVVNLIVDYPSYLKNDPSSLNLDQYRLQKKLQTILEDYLGVDFGNPVHGELNLSLRIMSENTESWIKNVLNKEIKKHIKSMPDGNNVHSIRFEPKTTGNSDMRIVYKENSHRHMHQYDFRNKVRDYLKGLGYNKINVENV